MSRIYNQRPAAIFSVKLVTPSAVKGYDAVIAAGEVLVPTGTVAVGEYMEYPSHKMQVLDQGEVNIISSELPIAVPAPTPTEAVTEELSSVPEASTDTQASESVSVDTSSVAAPTAVDDQDTLTPQPTVFPEDTVSGS